MRIVTRFISVQTEEDWGSVNSMVSSKRPRAQKNSNGIFPKQHRLENLNLLNSKDSHKAHNNVKKLEMDA